MLLCPNTEGDEGAGDFGRFAAVANGEDVDAKASKPDRLIPDSAFVGVGLGVGALLTLLKRAEAPMMELLDEAGFDGPLEKGEVLPLAHGECLDPKRLGPFTFAKGELVVANAAKPPCTVE